jgi:hypothetical protein
MHTHTHLQLFTAQAEPAVQRPSVTLLRCTALCPASWALEAWMLLSRFAVSWGKPPVAQGEPAVQQPCVAVSFASSVCMVVMQHPLVTPLCCITLRPSMCAHETWLLSLVNSAAMRCSRRASCAAAVCDTVLCITLRPALWAHETWLLLSRLTWLVATLPVAPCQPAEQQPLVASLLCTTL